MPGLGCGLVAVEATPGGGRETPGGGAYASRASSIDPTVRCGGGGGTAGAVPM